MDDIWLQNRNKEIISYRLDKEQYKTMENWTMIK